MIKEILNQLYDEIKHGDEEHQQWLKDKIDEFALQVGDVNTWCAHDTNEQVMDKITGLLKIASDLVPLLSDKVNK